MAACSRLSAALVEKAGGKGVPFPVVEIASDHHEGDFFLDRLGHEIVKRAARGGTHHLSRNALILR